MTGGRMTRSPTIATHAAPAGLSSFRSCRSARSCRSYARFRDNRAHRSHGEFACARVSGGAGPSHAATPARRRRRRADPSDEPTIPAPWDAEALTPRQSRPRSRASPHRPIDKASSGVERPITGLRQRERNAALDMMIARLWQTAPPSALWDDRASVRAELFGVERLEEHARSLAAAQPVRPGRSKGQPLGGRVLANAAFLLPANRAIAEAAGSTRRSRRPRNG